MGMFLLGAAGLLIYRQKAITKGWPSTSGEVVSGFVYSTQSNKIGHRGTLYGARWLVRYRVGDSLYDSTTNAGFEMKDRDAMQKLVDEKPAGSKVQLLYDPTGNGRIVSGAEPAVEEFAGTESPRSRWRLLRRGSIAVSRGTTNRRKLNQQRPRISRIRAKPPESAALFCVDPKENQ